MVALVKEEVDDVVTLAIGDGANDVNMITEAHVGVGIKGVEGQQAARSADYAIGEFKLLKRLMFFHGRESYRKNSNLVLYNFFKNFLLIFPIFWFAFENNFSGQTAYDEIGYQLFNLLFTAFPMATYSLFDKSTTDVVLLKDPKYYKAGPINLFFSSIRFLRWFIWAVVYAFLITRMAISLFDDEFSRAEGTTYGYTMTGQVVFVTVIILCNFKMFSFAHSYSVLFLVLIFGSAALGFILWLFGNYFDLGALEHSFWRVLGDRIYYVYTFCMLGLTIIDWGVTKLYHYTVMREHFPPASEEEFLMEVYRDDDTHPFVKSMAFRPMVSRTNTLNFVESFYKEQSQEDSDNDSAESSIYAEE